MFKKINLIIFTLFICFITYNVKALKVECKKIDNIFYKLVDKNNSETIYLPAYVYINSDSHNYIYNFNIDEIDINYSFDRFDIDDYDLSKYDVNSLYYSFALAYYSNDNNDINYLFTQKNIWEYLYSSAEVFLVDDNYNLISNHDKLDTESKQYLKYYSKDNNLYKLNCSNCSNLIYVRDLDKGDILLDDHLVINKNKVYIDDIYGYKREYEMIINSLNNGYVYKSIKNNIFEVFNLPRRNILFTLNKNFSVKDVNFYVYNYLGEDDLILEYGLYNKYDKLVDTLIINSNTINSFQLELYDDNYYLKLLNSNRKMKGIGEVIPIDYNNIKHKTIDIYYEEDLENIVDDGNEIIEEYENNNVDDNSRDELIINDNNKDIDEQEIEVVNQQDEIIIDEDLIDIILDQKEDDLIINNDVNILDDNSKDNVKEDNKMSNSNIKMIDKKEDTPFEYNSDNKGALVFSNEEKTDDIKVQYQSSIILFIVVILLLLLRKIICMIKGKNYVKTNKKV